jgi:hypothetical protein
MNARDFGRFRPCRQSNNHLLGIVFAHLSNMNVCRSSVLLACLATLLPGVSARATTVGGFSVHGSLSATASYSDRFSYLGDTAGQFSLNLVDIILNSTHRFENGIRVGAQVYGFKLGDYKDLTLDFAGLDYAFNRNVGFRIGRNKLPHGLYNDSQDLDVIRTFASLPFSFYPRSLRAIDASFDGVSLYGVVGLGRIGSVDYQLYAGAKEALSGSDVPLLQGISRSLPKFHHWNFGQGVRGASVFWNLPVEGLRAGYSVQQLPKTKLNGSVGRTSTLRGGDLAITGMVDAMLGRGAWDYSGYFAGTPATVTDMDILFRTASAEYTTGRWTIAAEYKLLDQLHGTTTIPALARLGESPTSPYANHLEYYYGMISYQATSRLGLGYYYAGNNDSRNGSAASRANPSNFSKDHCPALSYSLSRWCVVKAEYHFLDGFTPIGLTNDPLPTATDSKWRYLVLKTTVSF